MKKQFFTLLLVMISLLSSATAWGQVCKIGAISFDKLEDALAYVNSYPDQEMTIIMLTDYTLPAGTYTLPKKATLVVPMSDEQETGFPNVEYISHNSAAPENVWVTPTEFRRLTFDDGVKMNVYGTIELSGKLHASSDDYTSLPYGPYGLLHMNEGAKMTLMDGSELRAWGFMTGKGETDARRGSTVREIFQMGDWKGGSVSSMLLGSDKGVFPVTQYYIQNIESPVKYHPGAKLSTMAAVSANVGSLSVTAKADVALIGVSGTKSMFLMDEEADQENTWVRKWYDTTKDQQVYEINSGAHIGSIVIDLGDFIEGSDLEMNSSAFVLPLTNNMKIHLLSGLMDFTQNTALLPGAEVEINKESVVSITKDVEHPEVKSGSLYIYDADQWGKYAYAKDGNKYTKVVRYTPSANGQPTKRKADVCPDDAAINVHGTFDTKDGYIFTSVSGANIYSSNKDAGTFVFTTEAKSIDYTEQVWQVNEAGEEEARTFVSAKLINKDLSYTETAGTGKSMSYCYMNDGWNNLSYLDCYAANLNMSDYMAEAEKKILGQAYDLGKAITQLYIKPREWVEIEGTVVLDFEDDPYSPQIVSVEGNEDHTFSDKATGNRRFILMNNNCQWWEVEQVEGETGLFHCTHPLNDTYYYWDAESEEWAEKRYTITWKNGDDVIDTYELPRGAMAEYLGTNPTKPMDEGYTYTFTGWDPALAPVTEDATYTAVYASTPRKYTVTLKSNVEGACSFTGAGAYDYNTTADISVNVTDPDYQFAGWKHDNTLGQSFTTTVTGDLTYTVLTSPAATIIRDGLTVGQWGTLCPKQNVANPTGATFYQISYLEEKGGMPYNMYFDEVEGNLEAGQPYFFIASATEIKGVKSGEVKNEGSNVNGFYGYIGDAPWELPFEAEYDVNKNNTYVIYNNCVSRINAATNIKSERCYIIINKTQPSRASEPAPVGAHRISMSVAGQNTATGVDQVQGDEVPSAKVIIDGTLYIIRDGRTYNAQGQLVK